MFKKTAQLVRDGFPKACLGFSSLGKGQLGPGMMMEAGLLPRAVPLSIGWASVGPGVLAYQLCKSLFQ